MAIRPLSVITIPIVTSLPTDPTDTPEVDLVADDAGTYGGPHLYRCKYRAASAGTYKWHIIGAPPELLSESSTASGTASGTYVTLAGMPSLIIPFAGVWEVTLWSQEFFVNAASNSYAFMSYTVGATASADADALVIYGTANLASLVRTTRKTVAAASTTLQMQAKVVGTGTTYPNANNAVPYGIRARPVKLG